MNTFRIGSTTLILFAVFLLIGLSSGLRDFERFECALDILHARHSPYDFERYAECALSDSAQNDQALSFPYPPQVLGVLSPLMLFPRAWRSLLWAAVNAASCAAALTLLLPGFTLRLRGPHARTTLFLLTHLPLAMALAMGQLTPLFLLCISMLFVLHERDRRSQTLCGIALAILCSKPHLFWPLIGLGVCSSLMLQRWWQLLAAALTASLSLALPFFFQATIYQDYLQRLQMQPIFIESTSATSLLQGLLGWNWQLCTLLCLGISCAACGYIFLAHTLKSTGQAVQAMALGICLLSSPYLWPYDYLLALPAILPLLHQTVPSRSLSFVFLGANLLMGCLQALAGDWTARGLGFYPILVFCLILFATQRRTIYEDCQSTSTQHRETCCK